MSGKSRNSTRISLNTKDTDDATRKALHLLPCHVQYDGKAPVAEYFPTKSLPDGSREAYFRGRHLIGTVASIPQDYTGYVFDTSAQSKTQAIITEDQIDVDPSDEPELEEVSIWKQKGKFDQVVVYGNTIAVDGPSNANLKAIEEWIALASVIHAT